MKKLRIGYVPNSKDLTAPGDRRRIVFWAKSRGHKIVTDLSEKIDFLVLSERSDLGFYYHSKPKVPLIFDLVDGYLARESIVRDWLRGTSKVATQQLSGYPKPYTRFVQDLCRAASAVICSSPEQEEQIASYSENIHIILDSHDEIPKLAFKGYMKKLDGSMSLFWEGLPVTLGGVRNISPALLKENSINRTQVNFVTNLEYFRLLGKYFPSDTSKLINRLLAPMAQDVTLIPWSIENVVGAALKSEVAIIPVLISNKIQFLKPENRLLIMWKLGLPAITSAIPSYARISRILGTDIICNNNTEWESRLNLLGNDVEFAEEQVIRGQRYLGENHTSEILLSKWDKAIQSVL